MLNLDHILRVATAAAGAIVLSAVSIGATVGPDIKPAQFAFAPVQDRAHG